MKRILIIFIFFMSIKLQAQNVRMNAAAFGETFQIMHTEIVSTSATDIISPIQHQNSIYSSFNNINLPGKNFSKSDENNSTVGIVVQEDLVAGRVGDKNNLMLNLFKKMKIRNLFSHRTN